MANKKHFIGTYCSAKEIKIGKQCIFETIGIEHDEDGWKQYKYCDRHISPIISIEDLDFGVKRVETENSVYILARYTSRTHIGLIFNVPTVMEWQEIMIEKYYREHAIVDFMTFRPWNLIDKFSKENIYIMEVAGDVVVAFKK